MNRRAADFGVIRNEPVTVDMPAVNARMKSIVGASNTGLTAWLDGMKRVELIRGHGRFTGPHTVAVNDRVLEAKQIFINVGGRARKPDYLEGTGVPYLTNAGVMEVDYLPEHLIVVGGSYIGLEFAQVFRRFGSRVTIVHRGERLVSREDPDVSDAIREILEKEGIDVRLNAACAEIRGTAGDITVKLECGEGPPEVSGTHLLMAVGRVPNTDDLGLDAAGIEMNTRGYITVNDTLESNVPGVWALGDVNGRGGFTHTAYNDYEIVAHNLFDAGGADAVAERKVTDRILNYGLYLDPPLGRCGMTEAEAKATGRTVLKGFRKMKHVSRAKERSETDGFMKVLVDADTQQILGGTVLGIRGDEVVQALLTLMYAKAPYTVMSRGVYSHPTVTELLPTMLQGLRPLK
jgi:pyruvate/2-oxoglutarate dehydrogenase complex dihydrolipoamide dehydrogenase (E3) component